MTSVEDVPIVRPLGVFGPTRESPALNREQLVPLVAGLDVATRASAAAYLRTGTLVLALMEYTRDVLEDAFGVSGGSAVMTDGVYFWRQDAADYVERYGILLSEEVLQHMYSKNWRAPNVDNQRLAAIDGYLYDQLRAR